MNTLLRVTQLNVGGRSRLQSQAGRLSESVLVPLLSSGSK